MISCSRRSLRALVLLFLAVAAGASAQETMPTIATVPSAAKPSPNFNAEAATNAWMAEIPAASKAHSDAYFEGGYWLILWDFLYGVAVSLVLLQLGWSAAMRDLAERLTRFRWLQTLFYVSEYILLAAILVFPLTVYEGFFREHKYGLATQTFGPWMGDQFKSLLVNLVLGAIIGVLLLSVVRCFRGTWWIWGSLVSLLFVVFVGLIGPVYLTPIFNKVTKLEDPKVTGPILRLARANGIPAKDVYEIDASRQTTRMSANVSGLGGTMRITLNDNLLKRGSPEEILSVMGHEMGHYVLNHVYKALLFSSVVIFLAFAWLRWSLDWSLARWGAKWRVRDIADPAIVPLVVLLGSLFAFALTPILNTYIRTAESEADMYGLNASRQPDGFAQGAIHLGEYRKMKPGPIEEWIFFDHPSGYNRIFAAMRWKAENLQTPGAN
jgi:STE24 endopeptidase